MIDLGFLIDGSYSLNKSGENNFAKIVNLVKTVANSFSDPQTKIGIVLYATEVEVKANFTFTRNQAKDVLTNLAYPSGWTRTGTGLNVTRDQFFVDSRPNVHRVLVCITDGTSIDAVAVASDRLRVMNVTIIVIALDEWYDVKQVQRMASIPHAQTTLLTGFDELENRVWKAHELICSGN